MRELRRPIWIEKNGFEIGIGDGSAMFIWERFHNFGESLLNVLICDN